MTITIDFETKSYADLKKVGAWAYSEDLTTDLICVGWGIDDEPVQAWWPDHACEEYGPTPDMKMTHNMPHDLYMAIMLGDDVEAHNVAFEYSIWHNILGPRYGWVIPCDHQWRDTMAVACYYSMPPALNRLALALGFPGKDPEGGRLITKYSKLNLKTAKPEIPKEDFKKFLDYCVLGKNSDVKLEQSISDELGDLPDRELPIFKLDLEINARGLYLDQEGIDAATAIVNQRSETLTKEFRDLTGLNPTQGAKIKDWLAEQGVEVENMQADYLEELMGNDLPSGDARRALEIRLAINKASTKKLDAMSRQRGKDGRARFQTRYHGASTGRSTGSGFQPLNLSRGFDDMNPDQLVRDIMYGDAEWLDTLYGNAMEAVAKSSRYWIQAQEGNKIIAGDFASVEAVILACLAGEEWKIEAFRQGKKIYELMADKIYRYEPGTVTKATHPMERQDGKTGELAFGYQGALNAWLNFDSSGRHTDERIIEICKSWREEHPRTVGMWYRLQDAAIQAVEYPGVETGHGAIGFEVVDEWLTMILPNGKRLWYRDPQLRSGMPQWHQPETKEDCAAGSCRCQPQIKLSYMAQKTGQWKRVYTYGGKLCLSGDTKVLTDRGWLCILNIQKIDKLWDGEGWVSHGGLICQGVKKTIGISGVGMTPDHLILSTEGWISASQSERYNRAESWLPYGKGILWERWEEIPVEGGVHLRNQSYNARDGVYEAEEAGDNSFLRMQKKRDNRQKKYQTRYVSTPGVLGMAVDGGPLQTTFSPSLEKLWRSWYICLRSMEGKFREFLGRYGRYIPAWSPDRAQQQRQRVFTKQLPVGYARGSIKKSERQRIHKYSRWSNDSRRSVQKIWSEDNHNPLQITSRMGRTESVYDIADAGPKNRFVVRDMDGKPVIVHNCENAVQAASREVLEPAKQRAKKAGYNIILTVYDEIVCEVPKGFGSKKELEEIMAGPLPDWCASWPITVEAWSGDRYKK